MIYNVVLNSNLRVPGTTTSNAGYYFDWSAFQDGKYKLTWTFVSATCNLAGYAAIPMVEINLGQAKAFRIDPTNVQTATSNIVGIVVPNILATASFLAADLTTNSPVFLSHRPNNNAFFVRIMTNALVPVDFTDNAAAALTSYVLTLSLELVE